jgi:hypothetical protein
MKKYYDKNNHHAVLSMVIGFSGSFIVFMASLLFSSEEVVVFLEKLSVGLYIFACTVHGLSLTEQKKTMPAAGFTMMAIAQGVIFTTYFEPDDIEGYNKAYELFDGGLLLFFPAMLLIAFYTEFPRWVNILGVISCVPFLVNFILFEKTKHYIPVLDTIYTVSQVLLEITALTWAYFIWRNYKEELKHKQSEMSNSIST